ncbi:hypothetical protein M408DRAFT_30129 [Serendipita vermifera MAFF 305830]|uniref:Uncharacterized protein n=1 Tax=Serendipita vermifera MAFF 305830 TaxID=933852 RepID=A0A0C3AL26_SERVB|nr:hypothetical protein M408DRAFT_30129 [Serendipita vermifera MAFF 305830]
MVDDTEPDWRPRIDVGAHLSRNLPLQIVLRVPFSSEVSMTELTSRCATLIFETPTSYGAGSLKQRNTHINNSLSLFLEGGPNEHIRILDGDRTQNPFHYLNDATYDAAYNEIKGGRQIKDVLAGNSPIFITQLRLHHNDEDTGRLAIQVQLPELWSILPSLIHLNYLKLSESMVTWKKVTILPHISLLSLQTLDIECPMAHWILFSFEEDTWLGLFSVLDYLSVPHIESLILRGSLQRTLAVILKGNMRTCPSELFLRISSCDQAADNPIVNTNPAWNRLHRLRLSLPSRPEMFSRLSMDELAIAINAILSSLSKGCLVHIFTAEDPIDLLGTGDTPYIYHNGHSTNFGVHGGTTDENNIRHFVAGVALPRGSVTWNTLSFTEHANVSAHCYETSYLELFSGKMLDPCHHRVFAGLEYLKCWAVHATKAFSIFKPWSLRTLDIGSSYDMDTLFQCMMEHAEDLPHLTTLVLRYAFPWKPTIYFLGNFNKSDGRRGITTLRLLNTPHPVIMREIRAALNSGSEGYVTYYTDREISDYSEGCYRCLRSGWACFSAQWCTRKETGVSITKDTHWQGIDWYSGMLRYWCLTGVFDEEIII